jgi:type II secretory pathway component PulF
MNKKPFSGRDKVIRLIREYIIRNEAITGKIANQHYREATKMLNVMLQAQLPIQNAFAKISLRYDNLNDKKHQSHNEIQYGDLTAKVLRDKPRPI